MVRSNFHDCWCYLKFRFDLYIQVDAYLAAVFSGHQRGSQPRLKPKSDWLHFETLTTLLSKHLPPDAIELITKGYSDFQVRIGVLFES